MLKKKEIIVGIRLSGAAISRKMVIAIETGVITATFAVSEVGDFLPMQLI